MHKIDVPKHFSRFPAGRFLGDGPHSGQRFREELLAPAIAAGPVEVSLDGTLGYGSSFLEEAFGGLIREASLQHATIIANLKLISSDPALESEIWSYIKNASAAARSK